MATTIKDKLYDSLVTGIDAVIEDHLNPESLANLFWELNMNDQALFFNELALIVFKEYSFVDRSKALSYLKNNLTPDARNLIKTIADNC